MKNFSKFSELEQVFKALADVTRLRIVQMVSEKEMCVYDIFQELNISQPAVSHHLKILKQAGLIVGRKKGKWVLYSIDDNRRDFLKLIDWYYDNQELKNKSS
ncbi:ArsR/SmtB family transcription factor [Desulfitibacter alkalitolerans]|uniref:ArsR/SmtB family transcription factor n=1 Tax=Desulfitibacter alkalitolerans TaxID=264641 RepID=UPI0004857D6F|nr:metalloregulator ArsR/SmtB family transcription factor [Desulfitibacter alkalitolerans]